MVRKTKSLVMRRSRVQFSLAAPYFSIKSIVYKNSYFYKNDGIVSGNHLVIRLVGTVGMLSGMITSPW